VVFRDLGTSPLYVFNIFSHEIEGTKQIIGALSLIIYSLTQIPLVKYVFIVLRANNDGQGMSCILASLKFLLSVTKECDSFLYFVLTQVFFAYSNLFLKCDLVVLAGKFIIHV
jgi:K+ transporter